MQRRKKEKHIVVLNHRLIPGGSATHIHVLQVHIVFATQKSVAMLAKHRPNVMQRAAHTIISYGILRYRVYWYCSGGDGDSANGTAILSIARLYLLQPLGINTGRFDMANGDGQETASKWIETETQ